VLLADDSEVALQRWAVESPDIILLDVNLPKLAGFQVCRRIREQADTPIIMLTVREEEKDILVYRLRGKLSLARGLPDSDAEDSYLETVPGLGYGFMLRSQ